MRDFASCFSEHAVKVSDASCSCSSTAAGPTSARTEVTSLYHHMDIPITVIWSETLAGPTLSVSVGYDPKCHLLRKRQGAKSYVSGKSAVCIFWDYSASNFSGPEPVSNFYVAVVIDAELALSLGDCQEFLKKYEKAAEFSLVSREEKALYRSAYSTKVQFMDGGKYHEVTIKCDTKEAELIVSVDRKLAVQVRRLQWNFRGNQTIFVDGSPVDVMWDVGSWWFGCGPGYAAFLFRRRSALQSRLWLEEEVLIKEKGVSGFSLLIQAFKNS